MDTNNNSEKLSKGVSKINNSTPDERKEYRRDVIEACREMIARGYGYKRKLDTLAQNYGVTTRMAKKYLQWTNQDIEKRREEKKTRGRDYMLIQQEFLYEQLIQEKKYAEANKVLKEIRELEGYDAAKKINFETNTTPLLGTGNLTLQQKIEILKMLNPGENNSDTQGEDNSEGEVIEIK